MNLVIWENPCDSVRLKESLTFVELEKHDQISDHPFTEISRNFLGSIFRGIGLRMAENGGSYMFNSLAVAISREFSAVLAGVTDALVETRSTDGPVTRETIDS